MNEQSRQILKRSHRETAAMPGQFVTSNFFDNLSCHNEERLHAGCKDASRPSTTALTNPVTKPDATPLNITKVAHCSQPSANMTTYQETNDHVCQTGQKPQTQKRRKYKWKKQLLNDGIDRPYACSLCDVRFSMKHNMRRHIITSHDGSTLEQYKPLVRKQCDKCDKNFSTIMNLKIHQRVHHGLKLKYACGKCDRSFQHQKGLLDHENTHNGNRPFACVECGARFMSWNTWNQHKLIHSGELPNVCYNCNERYRYPVQLYKHQKVCTGKGAISQNAPVAPAQSESISLEQEHRVGIQPSAVGSNTADSLCCSKCGKQFKNKDSLRVHMKIHGDQNSFVCTKCGVGFPAFERLVRHDQSKHAIRQIRQCKDCGKPLKTTFSLNLHKRLHAGCPVCQEKFTMIKQMISHACSLVKVHECRLCSLTFTTFDELRLHRKLSNEHYINKPYVCMECPQRYVSQLQLEEHQKKHYRYIGLPSLSCSQCHKTFSEWRHLRKHENIHRKCRNNNNSTPAHKPWSCVDVKLPHVCRRCNQSFSSISILKLHRRTHSGKKCFLCVECDERFISLHELLKHEANHEDCKGKVKTISDSVKSLPKLNSAGNETWVGIENVFMCYICRYCDAIFASESALKDHRLAAHRDGNHYFDEDVNDKSAVQEEIRRFAELSGTSEIKS